MLGHRPMGGRGDHLGAAAVFDAAAAVVFGQDLDVAGAESLRGLALPGVAEAAHLFEADAFDFLGEQPEKPAAAHGPELLVVAGWDDLGADCRASRRWQPYRPS